MAVRFYDEAVTNKIKDWIKDPNLTVLKPDESSRLFEKRFDETKDAPLALPLISISRDKSIDILEAQKQVKTFDGFIINQTEKITVPLNVIPIKIGYQLDIYTRYIDEADEYMRNFVFNLINYPALSITLPYNNMNVVHKSIISLDPTIVDNSDIKEHLFADQFTRFTIKFTIDDAYLFSIPTKHNVKLEGLNLVVQDRITGEWVENTKII